MELEKTKTYYIIIDLKTLDFMRDGNIAPIENADKFESIIDAKKELSKYDIPEKIRIYKITETITRNFEMFE